MQPTEPIGAEFERRAFELVDAAAKACGLCDQVSAEAMQEIVEAVMTDLQRQADQNAHQN
jgi:hypothetical protein